MLRVHKEHTKNHMDCRGGVYRLFLTVKDSDPKKRPNWEQEKKHREGQARSDVSIILNGDSENHIRNYCLSFIICYVILFKLPA